MTREVRVGVGIIGTGFARSTQVPAFRDCPGVDVISIASAHPEKAAAVARDFGIPHATADWRDVLAHPGVDLVCISTPPALHREMSVEALAAGKAVLCEKPTALNASEAEAMFAEARARGLLALLDHELRFLPARRRARELIREGGLGAVRHARVAHRSDNRASASRPWDWWSDAGQGGGVLGAIGSHAVDALRFLLGREPSAVLGALKTHTAERVEPGTRASRPVTADEEASVLLRFGQDVTATVDLSSVAAGEPVHVVEVFGAQGALRIERHQLWRSAVGSRTWEPVALPALEPLPAGLPDNEWARGFRLFAREVAEALRQGLSSVESAATFEDGWRNQLVLDAARRSHEERRWVELTPQG
ncbi:Gfo/Idh/MocA family protein [Vitiosangium sp. GDMCC 1.1324]|uniref:Gfo/Idh/MocA family protein n=1 Tax=Vitiosangium sp. (strain GDMCC 1.1324) TaxID=2138576 RepID=UPI000D39F571|nr:Gfo/Idh/MocA family oxidoreductase [Vitiosangium sp. GDMCC 1.1324]PTL81272.1 gfo/Idh/MocA family oxidoreductase [Vitiosangium sp. GDMCC 1.1324]